MWSWYNNLYYNTIYNKIFKTMKAYLEKMDKNVEKTILLLLGLPMRIMNIRIIKLNLF